MIIARWQELFNIERYTRLGHYWKRFTTPDKKEKVIERVKQMANDDKFRALFFDDELLSHSEKMIGGDSRNPGIYKIYKKVID